MRTLLIDNYDSYTFNLFQLLAQVNGCEPIAVRNDEPNLPPIEELGVDNVVISPGPGHPGRERDFGICRDIVADGRLPVLGVCLGHQGIGHVHGAAIVRAPRVMHGHLSRIHHTGTGLFAGLPQGFEAVRYHSLVVDEVGASAELERIAWTEDGLCMGLRHRTKPLWGVQFHPESVLTEHGTQLLENFAAATRAAGRRRPCHRTDGFSFVPHRKAISPGATLGARVEHRRVGTWVDPQRAFDHLYAGDQQVFWLDSSSPGVQGARFSFMGAHPGGPLSEAVSYRVGEDIRVTDANGVERRMRGDLLEYVDGRLAELAAAAPELPFTFVGGYVGYLGYELKADCGARAAHRSLFPDAQLLLCDRFLAFDHLEGEVYVVALAASERDGAAQWVADAAAALTALAASANGLGNRRGARFEHNSGLVEFELARDYRQYVSDINECKRLLSAGETYELCLTNTISTRPLAAPLEGYRRLRRINPAPYAALLRFGDMWVLSSSPERFLRIEPDGRVEAKPIKGTITRGAAPEQDRAYAEALRTSAKDRAENLMVVDLLRNDLGVVCMIGSIHVPALMAIESYETVHQMVSTVRGRLRHDVRPIDCLRAAFPGGSMTGAPKLRTMEIIDGLEGRARGVYSGSIGYLAVNGATDLNIVIRSAIQTPEEVTVGAGGAIVIDSDPEDEFGEMLLKAKALVKAIAVEGDASPSPLYAIAGDRRSAPRPL